MFALGQVAPISDHAEGELAEGCANVSSEYQQTDGEGFDTVCVTPLPVNELRQSVNQGEAFSEAFGDEPKQLDADLLAIIEAWPTLSPTVRAKLMALIGYGRRVTRDTGK